jgi:hypothetical protein
VPKSGGDALSLHIKKFTAKANPHLILPPKQSPTMRFYTTLPLVLAVASASPQLLRSHKAAQINEIVPHSFIHKAAKTQNVANMLKRNLQLGDFNISDIFGDGDFDWGDLDLDLGDFDVSLCFGEAMEFGNVQCTCTLQSGDVVLTDMITIIANFNEIMEKGVDVGLGCLTLEPECYGNECGKVQVTCNMTLEFTSTEEISLDCNSCVEYTNGNETYPEEGVMGGQSLCVSLELCPFELQMEQDTMWNTTEILCGCNATLNDNECTCSLCGGDDALMGIELDCGDFKSTCTEIGFEMQNGTTSVAQTSSYLLQFEETSTAAPGDSTTSAAFAIATPFYMSGLVLALALA